MNIFISAFMGVTTGQLIVYGMWWQALLFGTACWIFYLDKH
jgi:hypothetical protein